MLYYSGSTTLCMFVMPSSSYYYHFQGWAPLKATDVEKNVMFQEETITSNADLSKDKRSVYRNRKLSKADRLDLYAERPDLDLRTPVDASGAPVKSAMRGGRAAAGGSEASTPDASGAGDSGSSSSARRRERGDRDERKARPKSPAADPVSREEKAASLFQSHVKAGTLVVRSVVPAGGDEGAGRIRSNSRSRSTSFHSGISDGKYDLLAPLLGAQSQDKREREQGPIGGAASYPQSFAGGSLMDSEERLSDSRAMSKKSYSLSPELVAAASGRSGNFGAFQENPLLRAGESIGAPHPMDVVSAGYRSSSTERVVGGNFQSSDLEAGSSHVRPARDLKATTAEEKEWELRRRLEEDQEEDRAGTASANNNNNSDDDLSSSDDESDDEDKELSIPISAL